MTHKTITSQWNQVTTASTCKWCSVISSWKPDKVRILSITLPYPFNSKQLNYFFISALTVITYLIILLVASRVADRLNPRYIEVSSSVNYISCCTKYNLPFFLIRHLPCSFSHLDLVIVVFERLNCTACQWKTLLFWERSDLWRNTKNHTNLSSLRCMPDQDVHSV